MRNVLERPITLKDAAIKAAEYAGKDFRITVFSENAPNLIIGQCVGFKNTDNDSHYYPLLFKIKRSKWTDSCYEFIKKERIKSIDCILFPQFENDEGYAYIVKSLITAELIDNNE